MKKFLLATAAAVLLPTSLFAADLPSRRAPPVFVPVALPVFSWTGFYAGVNAGYAFNGRHDYTLSSADPALAPLVGVVRPAFVSTRANGFTGGAQIGYNYELGQSFLGGGLVLGAEADAAYTDQRAGVTAIAPTGEISNAASRTDYVGTVRGRLGYAFDNFLVFGTGGFAYGGVRDNVNFFSPGGALLYYSGSQSTIRTGYSYGGGVEYAIPTSSFLNFFKSSAVTLKAEFIHYDLGTTNLAVANVSGGAAVGIGYNERIRYQGNLVRAGINYKFDFLAPVTRSSRATEVLLET